MWKSVLVTHLTSIQFFPLSLPPPHLGLHRIVRERDPAQPPVQAQPRALVSAAQTESRKEVGRGEWTQCCSPSWGTRLWLMQWLEHSWAAPSKHKNKWGSNGTVADCLDLILWTVALGWWPLYSGHCFRCWHDSHLQQNCALIPQGSGGLRIASLNPYPTIPFKRELFVVLQR